MGSIRTVLLDSLEKLNVTVAKVAQNLEENEAPIGVDETLRALHLSEYIDEATKNAEAFVSEQTGDRVFNTNEKYEKLADMEASILEKNLLFLMEFVKYAQIENNDSAF